MFSIASSHSVSKSSSAGGRQFGQDGPGGGIGAEAAAQSGEVRHQHGQQSGGDGGVEQQRLGRAANAGAAHFGVGEDGARHGEIGVRVDVGVVQPLGMGEHGHARLALHALHQRFAAARDDEVDQPGSGQHGGDEAAVGAGGDLHAVLGQAGLAPARR